METELQNQNLLISILAFCVLLSSVRQRTHKYR